MATKKCRNIYFPKYFVAVRKFTNIKYFPFELLLIIMVGSRIMHYSSFASYIILLLHKKATDRLTVA